METSFGTSTPRWQAGCTGGANLYTDRRQRESGGHKFYKVSRLGFKAFFWVQGMDQGLSSACRKIRFRWLLPWCLGFGWAHRCMDFGVAGSCCGWPYTGICFRFSPPTPKGRYPHEQIRLEYSSLSGASL